MVGRVCTAPGSTAYVAEVAGDVVGWAQAVGDGVLQSHLSFVAVHPDHRRRGIARLLVVATFQGTRTLRMDLVTDSAPSSSPGSRTRPCGASASIPAPERGFSPPQREQSGAGPALEPSEQS